MDVYEYILKIYEEYDSVGDIIEISGTDISLRVKLTELAEDNIKVGKYLLLKTENGASFAVIERIRVSAERKVALLEAVFKFTYLSEINKISAGISNLPALSTKTVLAPADMINSIIMNSLDLLGNNTNPSQKFLELGKLRRSQEAPVRINVKNIFDRHLAVVGTTGSGKSVSLGRIAEQLQKNKRKTILIDATGEYENISDNANCVYLGDNPQAGAHQTQVSLPYTELLESDLFAIFNPSGQNQGPKLKAAIQTLKLVQHAPRISIEGLVTKASRSKEYFNKELARHEVNLTAENSYFDIKKLTKQIELECVKPNLSAVETGTWGSVVSAEVSDCLPLQFRIDHIINTPTLAPIFQHNSAKSLFEVIEEFLTDSSQYLLNISLKYLSHEHLCREIIANAIGKKLMHFARDQKFIERPLITLVDEAHQFLNPAVTENSEYANLNAYSIIAKEGRKYGLHLGLATQRPHDIPEGVLSQIGTFLIHRLINDYDRGIIERASSNVDRNVINSTPNLATGQAIILGIEFPIPFRVMISLPEYLGKVSS